MYAWVVCLVPISCMIRRALPRLCHTSGVGRTASVWGWVAGEGGNLSCQAALRDLGDIMHLRVYSFSKTCFLGRENVFMMLSLTDGKGQNK